MLIKSLLMYMYSELILLYQMDWQFLYFNKIVSHFIAIRQLFLRSLFAC